MRHRSIRSILVFLALLSISDFFSCVAGFIFHEVNFRANPSIHDGKSLTQLESAVRKTDMFASIVSDEWKKKQTIAMYGKAFAEMSRGFLQIHLIAEAMPGASPCDFLFQVPLAVSSWTVKENESKTRSSIVLDKEEYSILQNCGSFFKGDGSLVLEFSSFEQCERFLNLLSAIEKRGIAGHNN
jgi:hypothetical protein